MGWIALAATAVNAVQQIKEGNKEAAAARADAALKAGQIRKLAIRTQGEARSKLAGSGVDVNSPSAKVIDTSIRDESELDAMNAILSGGRAAATATTASRINALGSVTSALGSDYGQDTLGISRWKTASPGGVGAGS